MISFSGRLSRQCTKLTSNPIVIKEYMSSSASILKAEQTSIKSLHKRMPIKLKSPPPSTTTIQKKQSQSQVTIQHDPKKRSSSPPPTNPIDIAAKAAKLEKLRLKQEREKMEELRAESNARFSAYLSALPQLTYPSHYTVECTDSLEATNERLRQLMSNKGEDKIFGLDLEWPPTFVKGKPENKVSLVQICNADTILLIQLSRMPGLPFELIKFFQDKSCLKSGVNIGADGLKLYRDFGIVTNGLVELRDMAEQTQSPKMGISHLRSLRALTGIFLDQNMAKGKVRISNWGKAELSPVQKKYAALDAYASYQLFVVLDDLLKGNSQPIKIRHLIDESLKKEQKKKKSKQIPNRTLNAKTDNTSSPTSTTTVIKKKN